MITVTRADIVELPDSWAEELANEFRTPSCFGLSPHGVLQETWPECKDAVREILEALIEMENYYGANSNEVPSESISGF